MSKTDITYGEWQAAIKAACDLTVPPEWITAAKFFELSGLRSSKGRSILAKMVADGAVESKMFKIPAGPRLDLHRWVWHYRLIKLATANGQIIPPKAKIKKTQ